MKRQLEICADSLEAVLAAEEGGADRLELCRDLQVEGLTPGADFLAEARQHTGLPLFTLIRSRAGDFRYGPAELGRMEGEVQTALDGGADGLVVGALGDDAMPDRAGLERLLELGQGRPFTFHRAFDQVADPERALEHLIELGFARVLTSGQAPTALNGMERLRSLVQQAGTRIEILVGGGVRAENLERLRRGTGAREFHSSVGGKSAITPVAVARLVELLR